MGGSSASPSRPTTKGKRSASAPTSASSSRRAASWRRSPKRPRGRAGWRGPCGCLAGVKALAEITRAEVEGATVGSTSLRFVPARIAHGAYRWDVGTAGAISLVLQAILVPLAFAPAASHIAITGGTHVPWSPPFPYVEQVLLPTLQGMGLRVSLRLGRWGFYPKGGGMVEGTIEASTLQPVTLTRRGSLTEVVGLSAVAGVPTDIAERQRQRALARLSSLGVPCRIETSAVQASSPGTVLFLLIRCEGGRAGFSSLGARGKPADGA